MGIQPQSNAPLFSTSTGHLEKLYPPSYTPLPILTYGRVPCRGSPAPRKPRPQEAPPPGSGNAPHAGFGRRGWLGSRPAPRAFCLLSCCTFSLYTSRGRIPRPWWVKRGSQGPANAVAAGTGPTRSASALLRRPICSPLPCRRPLTLRLSGLGGRWRLLRLETPGILTRSLLRLISVRVSFMAFCPALFKPSRPCLRHFWMEPPVASVFPFYSLHIGKSGSDGSLLTLLNPDCNWALSLRGEWRIEAFSAWVAAARSRSPVSRWL